jgi:HEAT repeat protein
MYSLPRTLIAGMVSGLMLFSSNSALGQATQPAGAAPESAQAKQTRLLNALKSPELTAEKAAAFEELAAFGTREVIPVLAPMLSDEKLAHYARFALEANPDPAVDELFRQSLDQLSGNLLIGVINSIGVRRDVQAIAALAARLTHENTEVADAAAHALGCIATPEAGDTLAAGLAASPAPRRAGIGRGCIMCAENLNKAGSRDKAIAMYDLVRGADVPQVIRLAGLRGAILARGTDGIALLVEQLRSDEAASVDVALRSARELQTAGIVPALIGSLGDLRPESAAGVILAIGDLGDTQAAPAVAAALASESAEVRIAALRSLKKIGDARVIPALWGIAAGSDVPLAETAKETLTALPGDKSDEAIIARLDSPEATNQILALELIGRRRITSAVPQLLKCVTSSDATLKRAALRALGETVSLEQMPVLVKGVIDARGDTDKAEAQTALTAACVRMPDRDACARMLTDRLASAPAEAKTVLLEQLGAMGGPVALACLADCAKDARADTQDAATRILGTWIGADVGPVLLDLARTINNEKYKIRVLRGYIRIASQFGLPHDEKMDMCTKALAVAQRNDERDLVLNVLANDPSPVALRIAVTQLDNPALKAKTADIAVGIAQTAIQDDPRAVVGAMQQVIRAGVGGKTETQAKAYLERAQKMQ